MLVLAVQNMGASNSIPQSQEIEFTALTGSLSMMSKGASSKTSLMGYLIVRFDLMLEFLLDSAERRARLVRDLVTAIERGA